MTIEADDLAKANAAYGDHSNNYLAINIPVDLDEDGTATVTVDAPMKAGTHSLTYIVSEAVNDAMLTAVTTSSGTADTLTVKAGAPNSIDEGGDKTLTEKLTVTSNAADVTLSTITLKVTDAQNDAIQGAKVKATLVGGDGWKLNSTANPTFVGTTGSDGTVSFTDLKVTPDTGAVAQTATIKFEVVDATDNTTVLKNTDDVELKAETKSLLLVTTGTGQSHEGTITDQSKLELNTTKTTFTFTTDDTVLLPIAEIKGVNGSVPAESATFTGKVKLYTTTNPAGIDRDATVKHTDDGWFVAITVTNKAETYADGESREGSECSDLQLRKRQGALRAGDDCGCGEGRLQDLLGWQVCQRRRAEC